MTGLTRTGWAVLASGVVLTALGILWGYAFLLGLGIAALAATAGAIAVTLVRYHISAERTVEPDRVTVGGSVRMGLTVKNLARLPSPAFTGTVHIGAQEALELPVPAMGGRGRAEVSALVTAPKRGLIRLSPVAIRRRDPLGLAHRAAAFSAADWLWVHPRVHHLTPLPTGLVLDFEGHAASRAHGGSATFANLREYAQGDDPRHIHWRTTARTGTLTVRHHVDTTEPATAIVIDSRAGVLAPPEFEEAVEIAASIAAASARAVRPFTLAAPSSLADATSHDFLDQLAALEQTEATLEELLATMNRAMPGGSLVVISGDLAGLTAAIAPQRRRFARIILILIRPPIAPRTDPASAVSRSAPIPNAIAASRIGGAAQGTGVVNRRPGMTVLTVQTAQELAALWPAVLRGGTS